MSRRYITYLIFFLAALILFLGNSEQRIRKALFLNKTIYYPLLSSLKTIEDYFNLRSHYNQLLETVARQTLTINELTNLLTKYEKSDIAYNIKNIDFILAEVVGYSGNLWERNLIINKGSREGIKADLPVITTEGVAGKIQSVSENYAIILPYNHSTFKLGVMNKKNKLQGLLVSDIYGNSLMTMLRLGSDISIGDTIVTSNISSIFPSEYPVGRVTKITESPNRIHMEARIEGFVDPGSLNQIIILLYEKDTRYEKELNN